MQQIVPDFRVTCQLLVLLAGAGFLASSSGCAVVMAARAPEKKDLGVLTPGVPRPLVITELGRPLHSQENEDGPVDIFAFDQGYSAPTRFSRSVFHGVADVLTVGLWEVAATPLEGVLTGEAVRAEVSYTPDGSVSRVQYYSGAHLADGSPTLAPWLRRKSTVQTAVIGQHPTMGESEVIQASGSASLE